MAARSERRGSLSPTLFIILGPQHSTLWPQRFILWPQRCGDYVLSGSPTPQINQLTPLATKRVDGVCLFHLAAANWAPHCNTRNDVTARRLSRSGSKVPIRS